MAKEKDKTQLQVLDELCVKIKTSLNAVHLYLDAAAVTETTRDTAMVKTKIDEALMWLERYHGNVITELAHKTCR